MTDNANSSMSEIETNSDGYQIEWLRSDEMTLWDDFVYQHPFGSFYHLSTWKNILENLHEISDSNGKYS